MIRPVWDPKIGLGIGLLWCETRSCHARRHNDLEGHSNFSSTIYSFSILETSLLWRSTVAFTYLVKVKSSKCLCWCTSRGLGLVSSGLGLGLNNLVLFTSPVIAPPPFQAPTPIVISFAFFFFILFCNRKTARSTNIRPFHTAQQAFFTRSLSPPQTRSSADADKPARRHVMPSCRIWWRSDDARPSYFVLSMFKMAAVRHLGF